MPCDGRYSWSTGKCTRLARRCQTTAAWSEEVPFEAEGHHRASAVQDNRRHRGPEAAGDLAEGIDCRHCNHHNPAAEGADGHILGGAGGRHIHDWEDGLHNLEEEGLRSPEGEDRRILEEDRRILEEDRSLGEEAGQANRSRSRPGHRDGVESRNGLVQGIQTWSEMKRFGIQAAQTMKGIKFSAADNGGRRANVWAGDGIVASSRMTRHGSAQPKRD